MRPPATRGETVMPLVEAALNRHNNVRLYYETVRYAEPVGDNDAG